MTSDPALGDGSYDVIVVDAEAVEDDAVEDGIRLEVLITAGDRKGLTIHLGMMVDGGPGSVDPIDALGLPGTLTVEGGRPRFRFDA